MPKTTWSKSTFEVLVANGKRWQIDTTSSRKSEAMDRAETLLSLATVSGVRVTEFRDDWTQEKTIFEQKPQSIDKPLQITLVPEVDICKRFADYYALPSRLTIGRVLRAYLDQHGLTALELMFNAGHLRSLDRMDTFFPSALQHAAQLQARKSTHTKMERMDKLMSVFNKVLKHARASCDEYQDYADSLSKYGIDLAIAEIRAANPKDEKIAVYGMLAAHIDVRSWSEKLDRAISLAEDTKDAEVVKLADEIIAEILDGRQAIGDLFSGFSTALEAWKVYLQVVNGRMDKPPKRMSPQVVRLNALFGQHDLTATRTVLLKRVSNGLGTTKALSKNGREADRSDFIGLVRDLVEPTGILGGPHMVEAIVSRTRSLLGDDSENLSVDTAIRQALYLMPSQASRLGVLLDFTASDTGAKHGTVVRQQLLHLLDNLRSIHDLFPEDVTDADRAIGLDQLRERLGMSALPKELKATLTTSLDIIAKGKTVKPKPKPGPKPKGKAGEMVLAKGQVLFHEGEKGSEAFLVVDGAVEVYRTQGSKKQRLATLGPGEIIGEMSLVDNQPRMASACATKNTHLICISQASLQKRLGYLAENDKVLHLLLKTMVRRLRGLARVTD